MRLHYRLLAAILLISGLSYGQLASNGKLTVHSMPTGQGMAVFNHKSFQNEGIVSTLRDQGGDSRILFAMGSSWSGASNKAYIDGFVTCNESMPFVFPLGGNGKYKPLGVTSPREVTAAYITGDSSFDMPTGAGEYTLLHASEYWVVQGAMQTKLTFTWNNENVAAVTGGDLSQLMVLAFNGTTWEMLPATLDTYVMDPAKSKISALDVSCSLEQGSITINEPIVPNTYVAYALGIPSGIVGKELTESDINTKSLDLSNYKRIKSIHFPFRESEVTRYSTDLLEKLATKLADNNMRIRLVGHADSYGSASYNYELGIERANAVKQKLEELGVRLIEVDIVSRGKEEAKYDCDTVDCDSRETIEDRRVDIYVYNKH